MVRLHEEYKQQQELEKAKKEEAEKTAKRVREQRQTAKLIQLEQFEKDKLALKQAIQDFKLFTSNSPRYREGFTPKLSMRDGNVLKLRGYEESPPTSEEQFGHLEQLEDVESPSPAAASHTSLISMGNI